MIALKRRFKILHYLAGLACIFYFAFFLGCAPDNPSRGEGDREHSAAIPSRRSADVIKTGVSSSGIKAHEKAVPSPIYKNVDSRLRAMIENMQALGITKENAKALGVSSLSTAFVRVNDEASIQTFVYVRTFGVDEKALLEARDVAIEISNEKLGIIQAWIPFDKVYEIAELPFVIKITPPSYGIPGVGGVTTNTGSIPGDS